MMLRSFFSIFFIFTVSNAFAGSFVDDSGTTAGVSPSDGFSITILKDLALHSLDQDNKPTNSPDQTRAQLEAVMSHLPAGDSMKCMLNDFADILKPDAYGDAGSTQGSNKGLDIYIHSLGAESKEFESQTRDFYKEVDSITSKPKMHPMSDTGEMPTMGETAGQGAHKDLKPGWLWNLALKYSKGDPNRAMNMIGVCGNDDTVQGSMQVDRTPDEAQAAYSARIQIIDKVLSQMQINSDIKNKAGSALYPSYVNAESRYIHDPCRSIDKTFFDHLDSGQNIDSDTANFILSDLKYCKNSSEISRVEGLLQDYKTNLSPKVFKRRGIACPSGFNQRVDRMSNSEFFLPESLGKGVDIPEALKNRIAQAQIPFECQENRYDRPSIPSKSCLPAKYYHVYGSAMVACEMIARGHNPAAVTELSALAGWYYRVFWLTSIATGGNDNTGHFLPAPNLSKEQTNGWIDALKKITHLGHNQNCTQPTDPNENFSPESVSQDAIELMRLRNISGDFGSKVGNVYTNIPIAAVVPEADTGLYGTGFQRPKDWSQERYDLADKKYFSIMSDFDWTVAQHRLGAEFAAKNCKPDPKKIAQNLCHKAADKDNSAGSR